MANFNLGKFDSAEKSARVALKLDTAHSNPDAHRLLGLILGSKRDYSGAIAELKAYIELASSNTAGILDARAQLAAIQNLAVQH
jgi:tetratricopeptide (TPR) repeat protein